MTLSEKNWHLSRLVCVGAWAIVLGWLFRPVVKATIEGFLNPANDMAYGFLVFPMSASMAFLTRKKLRLAAGRPAWGGLSLLLFSLVSHGFGQHSGQLFFSQLAMILSIPAVAWTAWGRNVARLLFFPTAYLLLVIPLHFPIFNSETLSWFSGFISSVFLNGVSVETVFFHGFNEDLMCEGVFMFSPQGHFQFHVADICSGMRSLSAITVFTAAYAIFSYKTGLRIFLLLAVSIPLVMLANIVRIILLCFVAIFFGQAATTPFVHETPGFIMFYAAVVVMMWLGDKVISKVGKNPSDKPPTPPARQLGWRAGIAVIVFGIMLTTAISALFRG